MFEIDLKILEIVHFERTRWIRETRWLGGALRIRLAPMHCVHVHAVRKCNF